MKCIYLVLLSFLLSCKEDKSCSKNYIGVFVIDTSFIKDSIQRNLVLKNKWDTIKLVSTKNGVYYFGTIDTILKKSEGSWYTKSNNFEGQCFGFIKQTNLQQPINLFQFDIMVFINDSLRFSLPFYKRIN
jgi:hypothetical protein